MTTAEGFSRRSNAAASVAKRHAVPEALSQFKVKTAPYKPNSLLAFFRSDVSFHGLEPLGKSDVQHSGRDVIQYVLYDKAARERQLQERRLAAAKQGVQA